MHVSLQTDVFTHRCTVISCLYSSHDTLYISNLIYDQLYIDSQIPWQVTPESYILAFNILYMLLKIIAVHLTIDVVSKLWLRLKENLY